MNLFLGYSGTPPANMVRWGRRKHYLTIEPLSSETLDADKTSIMIAEAYSKPLTGAFEVKLNDSDWTIISWKDVISQNTSYNLVKACDSSKDTISYGEKLQIRGLGRQLSTISLNVKSIGGAKVHGKISDSLTPEYAASTTLYKFSNFFENSTGLKDASGFDLYDGITLTEYCYTNMFSGCTSLINAPQLPATTLAEYCYYSMFSGCTNITELHYPKSIENDSMFKEMYGSPKFGATNAIVSYDL